MDENMLPVVVVGAGPIGLAAAAQLLDRGLEPLVLEAGPAAGAAVCGSGITCGCSPGGASWSTRPRRSCWPRPAGGSRIPDAYPTGAEWARAVPAAARRRPGRARALRRPRRRSGPTGPGPGRRRRPRQRAVDRARRTRARADGGGADRRARGRRRLRHLDDAEPARRRRPARPRRGAPRRDRIAYGSRPDRPRRPRPATPASDVAVAGSGHSALTALVGLRRAGRAGTRHTQVAWLLRRGARSATPSAAATPTSCPPAGRWASVPQPPSRPGTSTYGDRVPHRRRRPRPRTAGCG